MLEDLEAPAKAPAATSSPFAVLARRLSRHSRLEPGDRERLAALPVTRRRLDPYAYLIRERQPAEVCAVLLSGFAFRQKTARNGGRQIVALHVPGDALDLQNLYLAVADHAVQALTAIEIATVPKIALQALAQTHGGIGEALTRDMLIEAALYREWMLNLGRRDARTRTAHFLCELAVRLDAGAGGGAARFDLPMTQEQLGDLLGLTPIHVNRMLKALEADDLIARERRTVRIPDFARLAEAGEFDPTYLHLAEPTLTEG